MVVTETLIMFIFVVAGFYLIIEIIAVILDWMDE